ncbi:hypothetical protein [Nonomuraea sp. NPDC049646]|uniref:hypothetical protein n=1 Tax=unclassified Nonomuraea TaxID=2593643 RepID=UPI0037A1B9C0
MSRNIDPDAMWYLSRHLIRFPYLPDALYDRHTRTTGRYLHVTPASPIRLRRAAEQLCRQFDYETGMGVGYNAEHPPGSHVTVVLIPSGEHCVGRAELIAGAIGVNTRDYRDGPAATWVYVHPYERGRGLIDHTWAHMNRHWPGIQLAGPFTKAGERLRNRLQPPDRARQNAEPRPTHGTAPMAPTHGGAPNKETFMTNAIPPTWDTIATTEPLIAALDSLTDHAIRGIPASDTRWCANDFFHTHLKPFIGELVGWTRGYPIDEAREPGTTWKPLDLRPHLDGTEEQLRRPATNPYEEMLRTSEAYDVVYQRLLAKLPNCRNCTCA